MNFTITSVNLVTMNNPGCGCPPLRNDREIPPALLHDWSMTSGVGGGPSPKQKGRLSRLAGAVTGRVVETIDPDTVVDHVDLNKLLERIDVEKLLDRIDVDRLLDRVSVDRLLDHVDVNRLLDRVDVNRLLDRMDVNSLVDRVDPNRLLAHVDFEAILDNVDLEAAVRRAGVPEIVAESTGRVAGSALDLARRQIAGLDLVVDRLIDRLFGRGPGVQQGPPALIGEEPA
jgi:hypothetical protein